MHKADLEIIEEKSGSVTVISKDSTTKIIYIVGDIDDGVASSTISAILETDWEQFKDLHLYITSPGGYLSDCFAITDMLLHIKKKYNIIITTFGLGEVASAGFFIFIAGDYRVIFPSCRVFVHTHITVNNSSETYQDRIKADKTEQKEIYDSYIKYTATQLDLTIPQTKCLLKKSKWLSDKEIKTYNISKDYKNE